MARCAVAQLTFAGQAEEAINLYVSLFKNSEVTSIARYAAGESGPTGGVKQATFTIGGNLFLASDSAVDHPFTFTPSFSILVECESQSEFQRAFDQLSNGGKIVIPPGQYEGIGVVAWLEDRYGVFWRMVLEGS